LGQNKSKDDQTGVLHALNNSNNLNDLMLSNYMQKMNLV
jgi:predicted FMN-binding regulatory protein PaiB